MSNSVFDTAEIDKWAKAMLDIAERDLPKESKKFLRDEGTKLKKATLGEAKSKVRADHKKPERFKDAVHYHKSIKRGKVYKYNGALSIRTYSTAPHAHLIEYGFQHMSHGAEAGFVEGNHVFETSGKTFARKYSADCECFVDEVMKKL